jgi:hypothetical protein
MQIAILIFPKLTGLDAIGRYEVRAAFAAADNNP